MTFELTLADQAVAAAAFRTSNGSGLESHMMVLKEHPLAVSERGRPRGMDHVHLSRIGDTDFVVWMGRKSDGFHYPVGRYMKILSL